MPKIRLIGLVLFITAIMLTLAAAVTKTTHIRVKRPSMQKPPAENIIDQNSGDDTLQPKIEFISIPVIWPLLAAGGMGLLLWFSTTPFQASKPPRRKRRRRRK